MTPVVGVTVPDVPGGLGKVLGVISRAGIDVEYMYSVFGQKDGKACMIFRVADSDGLMALLEKNGIGTISGDVLYFADIRMQKSVILIPNLRIERRSV